MRDLKVTKSTLKGSDTRRDLKDKTPGELIEMVDQLTLDAWAFKENLDVEPRLQRHIVVVKKRRG
jgi:hypothetical protein